MAEGTINFTWDVPMLGAPQFSSNIFAIEPRILGSHCEICLHFSSDETFLLQFKEDSVYENQVFHNNEQEHSDVNVNAFHSNKRQVQEKPIEIVINSPILGIILIFIVFLLELFYQ